MKATTLQLLSASLGALLATTAAAQIGTNAAATPFGTACRTSQGRLLVASGNLPVLGDQLCSNLSAAPPAAPAVAILGPSLNPPIPLDAFGAVGCTAYVDFLVTVGAVANGSGDAQFCVPLRPDAALDGARVSSQWAVLDPAANTLGLVLSNAVAHVIGVAPQLTVTGISATTLNAGDAVTLQGVNLPLPVDACALVMDPVTGDFARLEQDAAVPSRFRLTHVPAGGIPNGRGVLGFMRGRGTFAPVAGTPRLSAPGGRAWAWDGVGFQQNKGALPGITVNVPPLPNRCVTVFWTVDTVANEVVCTLPASIKCGVFAYPLDVTLTTDVHPDAICTGAGASTHYDFFMQAVRVISGVPVFYGQIGAEHAGQISAQMAAKYGAGRFVFPPLFDGRMVMRLSDPACRFTGPNGRIVGKTIVCCP